MSNEGYTANRDTLRLLDQIERGKVSRSGESGRDVLRQPGNGAFNNNLGGRVKALEELGLVELPATNLWRLTDYGHDRRAEARARYGTGRQLGQVRT